MSFEPKSMHIAVYALSLLGGAHSKVHTEEIAQKCFEIAPDRFKWERYRYPDKELVRKALFHASEAKNGSLVTGRSGIEQRGKSRDGWQLTPAGAAWAKQHEPEFRMVVLQPRSAEIPKRDADRLLKRLRNEDAFRAFLRDSAVSNVSQYMFTDFLNCSPDASPDLVRAKFERLLTVAQLLGDGEVVRFLRGCEAKFELLLGTAKVMGSEVKA